MKTTVTAKMLAVSRAGHDCGKTYVVIGEDSLYADLVNGSTRPLAKPKRKKWKHVQVIRHLPDELLRQMQMIQDDSDVRRILKQVQAVNNQTDR